VDCIALPWAKKVASSEGFDVIIDAMSAATGMAELADTEKGERDNGAASWRQRDLRIVYIHGRYSF
jgi:hypothetical protein